MDHGRVPNFQVAILVTVVTIVREWRSGFFSTYSPASPTHRHNTPYKLKLASFRWWMRRAAHPSLLRNFRRSRNDCPFIVTQNSWLLWRHRLLGDTRSAFHDKTFSFLALLPQSSLAWRKALETLLRFKFTEDAVTGVCIARDFLPLSSLQFHQLS